MIKTKSCRKRGRKQSRGRRFLPQRCPQPVEQLPRRPCAAGLTDSRASRATRATRGDAHAARQSAPWQYCTSQHGVEQCIQDIVLGASMPQDRAREHAAHPGAAPARLLSGALTTAQPSTSTRSCTAQRSSSGASPCCRSFVQCSVRAAQSQADPWHARAAVGRRPAERVRAASAAVSPAAASERRKEAASHTLFRKERKKENTPKGGMGERHAATNRDFKGRSVVR